MLYVHVDVLYGHEYALGLVEELYEKTTFVARVERLPARGGVIQNPARKRTDLLKIQQERELTYSKSSKKEN